MKNGMKFKIRCMKIPPQPKSLRLFPSEWENLRPIAQRRGISRHRLMTDAVRSILQSQNPEVA